MSIQTRAFDDETGRPVVVLVATGSNAVARLVAALRTGGAEYMMLAGRVVDQVKRHNGGRDALRLLAAHGGPDLLAEESLPAWHTVRRYLTGKDTASESDVVEVTHPDQCHQLPAGAVCWYDHAGEVPWWPWDQGTFRIRPVWETTGAEVPERVQVWQVKVFDTEAGTWADDEDIIGDYVRCTVCRQISDAGEYTIIASPDNAITVCVRCRYRTDAGQAGQVGPGPVVCTGDVRDLIAIHEAGHAVTNLLLGHNVTVCAFDVHGDGDTAIGDGYTLHTSVNTTELAELVTIAAGEAAVRHMLKQRGCPSPDAQARGTAQDDRALAQVLADQTGMPVGIGAVLAEQLVTDYWPAIKRLADALCAAPGYRLVEDQVLDAAGLAEAEISWDRLCALAVAAMPDDPGLQAYLAGPGRELEEGRADFLARLRAHDLLTTPADGLRRQVHAEIFSRGMFVLEDELLTAESGGAR